MARKVESSSLGNDTCTGIWSNNSGKFTHNWRISQNAYDMSNPGFVRKSSTFSPEDNDKIKWYLRVCPKIVTSNNFNAVFNIIEANKPNRHLYDPWYIVQDIQNMKYSAGPAVYVNNSEDGIFLYCMTTYESNVTANIEISVFDVNGVQMAKTVMKHHKLTQNETKCKLLQQSDYGGSFPTTINCEILLNDDAAVSKPEISQPIRVEALKPRTSKDFSQFFMSQDLSDITLTVGGKVIPAHKMILASCSPVFSAMFKDNTEKLKTNCLTINDIEHEVVLEMLRFIYMDEAPNLNKMASKLLMAAEKYSLERLKVMCAETLRKTISVSNVIDIWVLSHLHKEVTLKNAAVYFICKNIKNMIKDASLLSIAHLYPDIMIEIVRILSEK